MTRFLATTEKPDGWKLEDILSEIQNDIIRRTFKIIDDHRPEARTVMTNNIHILSWLDQSIESAKSSTKALDALGPSQAGKGGPPRIGEP